MTWGRSQGMLPIGDAIGAGSGGTGHLRPMAAAWRSNAEAHRIGRSAACLAHFEPSQNRRFSSLLWHWLELAGRPDDGRAGALIGHRRRHRRGWLHRCYPQPVRFDIGNGPGRTGGINLRGRPVPLLPGSDSRPGIASFGPGVDVSFPNDPYLIPFMVMEEPAAGSKRVPNRITNDLLKNARLIATPEERSLALQRIANGAIGANQLNLAHQTLEEAITATSDVTIPLVRDQRLIAIVTSLNFLTEALLREGNQYLNVPPAGDTDAKPEALPKRRDSSGADPDGSPRMAAWGLSGLDHRQPDLSQRDALQGRRK